MEGGHSTRGILHVMQSVRDMRLLRPLQACISCCSQAAARRECVQPRILRYIFVRMSVLPSMDDLPTITHTHASISHPMLILVLLAEIGACLACSRSKPAEGSGMQHAIAHIACKRIRGTGMASLGLCLLFVVTYDSTDSQHYPVCGFKMVLK